jgi:hypothetical protein
VEWYLNCGQAHLQAYQLLVATARQSTSSVLGQLQEESANARAKWEQRVPYTRVSALERAREMYRRTLSGMEQQGQQGQQMQEVRGVLGQIEAVLPNVIAASSTSTRVEGGVEEEQVVAKEGREGGQGGGQQQAGEEEEEGEEKRGGEEESLLTRADAEQAQAGALRLYQLAEQAQAEASSGVDTVETGAGAGSAVPKGRGGAGRWYEEAAALDIKLGAYLLHEQQHESAEHVLRRALQVIEALQAGLIGSAIENNGDGSDTDTSQETAQKKKQTVTRRRRLLQRTTQLLARVGVLDSGEGSDGDQGTHTIQSKAGEPAATSQGVHVVFVAIQSARQNWELRAAIRRTWVDQARRQGRLFDTSNKLDHRWRKHDPNSTGSVGSPDRSAWAIAYKFFVAKGEVGELEDVEARLEAEQAEHRDIVVLDFVDAYRNLTLKSAGSAHFVSTIAPGLLAEAASTETTGAVALEYMVKLDDDVYLDTDHLLRFIAKLHHTTAVTTTNGSSVHGHDRPSYYGGVVHRDAAVVRDPSSQWFVPLESYSPAQYPPYARGSCYLLSADAARIVGEAYAPWHAREMAAKEAAVQQPHQQQQQQQQWVFPVEDVHTALLLVTHRPRPIMPTSLPSQTLCRITHRINFNAGNDAGLVPIPAHEAHFDLCHVTPLEMGAMEMPPAAFAIVVGQSVGGGHGTGESKAAAMGRVHGCICPDVAVAGPSSASKHERSLCTWAASNVAQEGSTMHHTEL